MNGVLECVICSEMMHAPCTAECGHSFCYECLSLWFHQKMACPTCRHEITTKPVPNLMLKDISQAILDLMIEVTPDAEEKERLSRHRQDQCDSFYRDQRENRWFHDQFESVLTPLDRSDGVPRCGACHWEAHGLVCLHCGARFRTALSDDDEDEAFSDEFREPGGAHGDDYDSDDSFLDTRPLQEIQAEAASDSEGFQSPDHSVDHDLEIESLISDDQPDWEGFAAERHDERTRPQAIHGGVVLSSSDDDDFESAMQRFQRESIYTNYSDDNDSDDVRETGFRARAPRIIHGSDSDSDND